MVKMANFVMYVVFTMKKKKWKKEAEDENQREEEKKTNERSRAGPHSPSSGRRAAVAPGSLC